MASAICGGTVGFLLGAAFWIILGLQELTGGDGPRLLAPAWDAQGLHDPGCTSLALDRHKGRTIAEPCLGPTLPLREALAASLGGRSLH